MNRGLTLGAAPDAGVLLLTRGVRAFGDGLISVILPIYLTTGGFGAFQVGALSTATLVGSAVLTLAVGLVAHRFRRRQLLLAASVLMAATGLGFAVLHGFWPLMVVAFIGTLNPSNGDVSVFLPLEQALLPPTVEARSRTALFARYSLAGALCAAFGSLCAGVPGLAAARWNLSLTSALEATFLVYGALGLVALVLYRRLSIPAAGGERASTALGESRRRVYGLAGLFSLDAFGGGLVVQSLLALWLFQRFNLSLAAAGTVFFWTSLLSAASFLLAAPLARRIGLVNTMVFTHLPANLFLLLVPFMPTLPLALALLMARSALSQMDVPTRTSYVMAVVAPEERPAAASVTSVPRSLASAASPLLSGYLLALSPFGWPLALAGATKAAYDLLLLATFSQIKPPEEQLESELRG